MNSHQVQGTPCRVSYRCLNRSFSSCSSGGLCSDGQLMRWRCCGAHLWIGCISIQGGGGSESSLAWAVVECRYSPTSAFKYVFSALYVFLLQSAAESLVLVDTRVANGCVVERPSMWIITESRLWLQN